MINVINYNNMLDLKSKNYRKNYRQIIIDKYRQN